MWMAGGGVKRGTVIGETDDFGYNVTEDPVHVHDLQATMLRLPGDRSHQAHVLVPGAAFPLDRCGRIGRETGARLNTQEPAAPVHHVRYRKHQGDVRQRKQKRRVRW